MELKDKTVETLIELDEPEALLSTLQRAAARKEGERCAWLALALSTAEDIFNKHASAMKQSAPHP
jgi:hypothetical protein